ncbi:hypothetical protein [Robertkochia flava]|uniref:hypothetical protein n=1 Tax=Robertkochia flava TaxID=3447986 RepID=UPI001CCFA903|nr:hypothetical protein [Robertkochia marina]
MEPEGLLNAHQHKLHHLAQFLAAFGNSYLPAEPDDSQTNLGWDIEKSALISRIYNEVYLELEYPGLMLYLVSGPQRKAFDPLGASPGDIESWIRETLSSCGIDPGKYRLQMGFTPTSPEDLFISLDNTDEKVLLQLTEERNIAQKALEEFRDTHPMECSPVRIWPHHFDTGMLVYPDPDTKSKSFGLGYAPADRVSEVPYFYAYARSDRNINYDGLPEMAPAQWHINNWKGALIPVDRALDLRTITRFYKDFTLEMKNRI